MTSLQIADGVFLGNMKTILALAFSVGTAYWIMYTIEMFTEWQFLKSLRIGRSRSKKETKDAS